MLKPGPWKARGTASQTHLIRFFRRHLGLYRKPPGADNGTHPDTSVAPLPFGGLMTKMALFLFGFLVLTIGIGLLATISPV
ncbi:hypothetical protein F3K53_05230 [Pseudomonas veronii]|uniref:Uncharacterized protein n=1 Tax=Pseudomonas veronii TaxID=76761 RepID=A0A5M8FSD8_PSEVE|nr:hypothetical protein F3K54_03705 [Pseudomonas veronii]KAA6184892.1 hypothetical protein F3K53_05230 [Pseudomonas veronii]